MRQLWMGILAVGSAAALACGGGGGGGGGGRTCHDLANTVNQCITSGGDEADPDIEGTCDVVVCDDKPATIDCVMALTCSADMGEQSMGCMQEHGCAFPASCEGVAYLLHGCADTDVAEAMSTCDGLSCTISKQATLECLVALDCEASYTEVRECFTRGGCPTSAIPNL